MSLTVLKLDEGRYYYTSNGIEKAHYCNVNGCVELVTPKGEILSPVPTYDELAHLETRLEMAQVQNAELMETQASLSSQIKQLLSLQDEEDREVERLRELLKECKNIVAHDLWSRAQFPDGQVVEKDELLTRINAAIGESEEQNETC